jgi:hypothetical protein
MVCRRVRMVMSASRADGGEDDIRIRDGADV